MLVVACFSQSGKFIFRGLEERGGLARYAHPIKEKVGERENKHFGGIQHEA